MPEFLGTAPGRGRLTGRRVLVVGAGTRPSPEPDPPIGNGRAISVLAAREGAAVACADRSAAAAEQTAALVRGEGQDAAVVLADVARPGGHSARAGGLAAQPGPDRAEPAVRPAGHGLGGGLRRGVAAVRGIQLRQRASAGAGRRRDQLFL
jgi:NAD(P)-dependent dehydrogenase (short-subunit alcohol dehydrogenase family)